MTRFPRPSAPLKRDLSVALALMASSMVGGATLPDFGAQQVSAQARAVAHWALRTGDHGGRVLVIVDKRQARVFVLEPSGRLAGTAPVLLGSARGDHSVPGIGERPLSQIHPEERTTPAGRFIAEPGVNAQGEDIVWVDYASAVSMHRVRARVPAERRLQRLATPTPHDNRISYGCINLPPRFYDEVLAPRARAGAVIYVLPEVRSLHEVFGWMDPTVGTPSRRAQADGPVRQRLRTLTDGVEVAAH